MLPLLFHVIWGFTFISEIYIKEILKAAFNSFVIIRRGAVLNKHYVHTTVCV